MTSGSGARFPEKILAIGGGLVTVGGAERMFFASLALFRRKGSKVHLIVNNWQNEAIVAEAEKIGATWSEGSYATPLRWRNQPIARTIRGAAATIETSRGLLRDFDRFKPGVVFVSDFEAVLRNAVALGMLRARNVPVVLYMQNSPPLEPPYPALFRWIIDPLISHYAVVSQHTARELAAFGIDAAKISYINTFGLPPSTLGDHQQRNPKLVVFAGQMIPQKGLDILLEAFAIVSATDGDARLHIATRTDGWIVPAFEQYRESVLLRAEEPDLRDKVKFLGWHPDVPSLLSNAGVHVAPSRPEMHEGMPLVVLEAQLAATPSVVPDFGPFPELVKHRTTGWLCRSVSAEAFARGIGFFLAEPGRARRAGEAALALSAQFSEADFERRWENLFRKISPVSA